MHNIRTDEVLPSHMSGRPPFSERRGQYADITAHETYTKFHLSDADRDVWDRINLIYRTLCGILYNFVPTSGHPGGSISSGHIVQALVFESLNYDFKDPDRLDNDIISYAAGHKAMGLYAMWALRNELVRLSKPELLAPQARQLRLEDLLGFRRNPTQHTPLFEKHKARALDGHPTCATPFMKVATGASGVGVPASLGLAHGALDYYGDPAPRVHFVEGEGGMTPGRVHEAMAAAATAQIYNAYMHVDWNQSSIDSDRVCREDSKPGDYVQWNPAEIAWVHDWNVVLVPNATDFRQVLAAQSLALQFSNRQPTCVVYRTVKGWHYGIEGSSSHGAGHKFNSEGYYKMLKECEDAFGLQFPRFQGEATPVRVEETYFDTLMTIRKLLEAHPKLAAWGGEKLAQSRKRLAADARKPRPGAPHLDVLYTSKELSASAIPEVLRAKPGDSVTTRGMLGDALNVINQATGGAVFVSAADLAGSTNISNAAKGFGKGFYNAAGNPASRLIPIGGICEDAMGAWMAGLSSFGRHIGVTASYGAFIAALEHVAARLHGIGQQTLQSVTGEPYRTWIMVNAHAGVKTGEDGPTHADPQALQLLQECFPGNVLVTLTPWDALEVWPLLLAGLRTRPAVLAPFVTRPNDTVVDRVAMKLPPPETAVDGVYAMRTAAAGGEYHGTLVLQGNGVGTIFVSEVLPVLDKEGWNFNIYYVASAELFNLLTPERREAIFPERLTVDAMGITDFTLPTLFRWVRSNEGQARSLHSFRGGHYLGSGTAAKVLEEAGIHAEGQLTAIRDFGRYTADRIRRKGHGRPA
jgi:transketolase